MKLKQTDKIKAENTAEPRPARRRLVPLNVEWMDPIEGAWRRRERRDGSPC